MHNGTNNKQKTTNKMRTALWGLCGWFVGGMVCKISPQVVLGVCRVQICAKNALKRRNQSSRKRLRLLHAEKSKDL